MSLGCILKFESVIGDTDLDDVSGFELALEDRLRQRVFDLLLDGSLQWPCPINRIKTGIRKSVPRRIRKVNTHVALRQPIAQIPKLDVDDVANMLATQRVEYDHIVDPVDELRSKVCADDIHHSGFHRFIIFFAAHFLDHLRAQV